MPCKSAASNHNNFRNKNREYCVNLSSNKKPFTMDTAIQNKINTWLNGSYDQETQNEIRRLQKENPEELTDAFYRNLEFGTGGLRGLMGVGTNRMNKYTVGMCTQGFANYLKKTYGDAEIKVAIGHDSRNNSRFFAETTANVFAANGIKVYLFESLRPTPELSFAIRYFKCNGGVICTASHNPKEYNGYKAYWNDGGQLVPPHDKNVINEVEAIHSVDEVKWSGGEKNITIIGKEIDDEYIKMVKSLSVYPDVIALQHDLKIFYTPIHGTGIMLVPAVLKAFGFTNVHIVEEQSKPDGNFPTVVYPNPEESEAMSIGLKKARSMDADILAGTDPDADRVGIVVKTIVTTDLIHNIARTNNVKCYDVLTGFKWIAELIKEKEGKENYVIGGEESFGMMIGDKVRDKDAVSAVAFLCEMAAYEKSKGNTLYDKLIELYIKYGFYLEHLISLTKKGMRGQEEITEMMQSFRNNPPTTINSVKVVQLLDYQLQIGKNLQTKETWDITLPKSNVLQFILEDGTKISARPSGTEPKIKFYFSVNTKLNSKEEYDAIHEKLEARIKGVIEDMKLK